MCVGDPGSGLAAKAVARRGQEGSQVMMAGRGAWGEGGVRVLHTKQRYRPQRLALHSAEHGHTAATSILTFTQM